MQVGAKVDPSRTSTLREYDISTSQTDACLHRRPNTLPTVCVKREMAFVATILCKACSAIQTDETYVQYIFWRPITNEHCNITLIMIA